MRKKIEFNSNANIDNRSVISKSSRLTKKNPEQPPHEIQQFYFKKGTIGDKVLERTNYSKSKQKQNCHLEKAGKIVEELMQRHRKAKQKLQRLKQQSQKQHDRLCPFTPKKNKMKRYQVEGDIIRRNEVWMRQKKRKQLELVQNVTLEDLRQCTFSPNFQSRKTSQSYLKFKDVQRSLTPKNRQSPFKSSQHFSPYKHSKRNFTQAQYQMAKRNLISKMMVAIH